MNTNQNIIDMRKKYKKLLLFFLLLFFQSSIGFCWTRIEGNTELGQEVIPYDSLLAEGRKWCSEYLTISPIYSAGIRVICVEGNYICNGKSYKKIKDIDVMHGERNVWFRSPMREEDGRIYRLDTLTQKEYLDFDTNLKVGEGFTVNVGDNESYDVTIQEIKVLPFGQENTPRTCFILDLHATRYVTGLGYCDHGAPFYEEEVWNYSYGPICCHNADGTDIYNRSGLEDHDCPLNYPLVVGIKNLNQDYMKGKNNNSKFYNLQGQRIKTLQKGLNIVDGKKMWVR